MEKPDDKPVRDAEACPLGWTLAVRAIPEAPLRQRFVATASERQAIAAALDLPACDDVALEVVIKGDSRGTYRMKGQLTARIVQACIVSLAPVPASIDERLLVEFRPDEQMPGDDEPIDPDSDVDIEPIERGVLAIGRVAFETLSAALDPYPRAPGVAFDWKDEKVSAARENPFAALAKLKKST